MEDQTIDHLDHREHAEHAAHAGDPFISKVAVTIAVLAVVAAGIGSLQSVEEGASSASRNDAVLLQDRATDQWNFYQAKSIKQKAYEIAAAGGGPNAAGFTTQAKQEADDDANIQKQATAFEAQRDEDIKASEAHDRRNEVLTIAVTLLHVSIAIATISIIMRGARWPWIGALALGAGGCIAAAYAYL